MADLTHYALPCPPADGYVPSLFWNATYPAGSVQLSTLGFDPNGSTGVLPPFTWAICFVDLEPSVVEATSETELSMIAR